MERYYVFKDGQQIGSTADRKNAIVLIRQYQEFETHPWLKSEFSIIKGEEEFIPYPNEKKSARRKENK